MTSGGYVSKITYRGELKNYEFKIDYLPDGKIEACGIRGMRCTAPDFQFLMKRIHDTVKAEETGEEEAE